MDSQMHEKILESCQEMIIDLTVNLPYYGHFLLFMNFKELESVKTCGVNITSQGMNFYYSPKFLDGKTQKEVNFIVIHEIFHLLWSHPKRTISGQYEHKLANIAQDMIINHIIWQDISHSFVEIPKDDKGKNMALFVPKEYDGRLIFEELYEWLREEREERKKRKKKEENENGESVEGNSGEGDGNSGEDNSDDETDSSGKPSYGKYGKMPSKKEKENEELIDTYSLDHLFDNLEKNQGEYLDHHIGDEVPEEMREAVMRDVMDKLRSRGYESGNITGSLDKLRKKRKDHLSFIKRSISNQVFGSKKIRSILKPNRRSIFGIKGRKKIKNKIVVILDTSGSMGGTFENIVSYVYRNDIEMIMIEADTNVKWVQNIKSKQKLQSTKIVGGGGTILQPAIDFVVDNYNNLNLLVLTDGLCDTLDISEVNNNILVISIEKKVPIAASNGKLKQIIVEKTS